MKFSITQLSIMKSIFFKLHKPYQTRETIPLIRRIFDLSNAGKHHGVYSDDLSTNSNSEFLSINNIFRWTRNDSTNLVESFAISRRMFALWYSLGLLYLYAFIVWVVVFMGFVTFLLYLVCLLRPNFSCLYIS